PTAALTETEIDRLFEIILKLKKRNVGMFYITHRLDELDRICDTVSVIRDGEYIGTDDFSKTSINEIVKKMVGRSLDNQFPDFERKIGDVYFEARDVKNKYVSVDTLTVRSG